MIKSTFTDADNNITLFLVTKKYIIMKNHPSNYLKIVLLSVIVFITVACSERNGTYVTYHNNGNIRTEANYTNGKLDGSFKTFYPDGQEEIIAHFTNGKIIGEIMKRNKTGRVTLSCRLNDKGLLEGPVKISYPDGLGYYIGTYKNGNPVGEFIRWYASGKLMGEKSYNESHQLVDTMNTYYEKGQIMIRYVFSDDGNLDSVYFYHENGDIAFEGRGEDGLIYKENEKESFSGQVNCYYQIGKKSLNGSIENGKKTGYWTGWHENGQKLLEGKYNAGNINGNWKYWSKDGMLMMEMIYQGGVTHISQVKDIQSKLKQLAKKTKSLY